MQEGGTAFLVHAPGPLPLGPARCGASFTPGSTQAAAAVWHLGVCPAEMDSRIVQELFALEKQAARTVTGAFRPAPSPWRVARSSPADVTGSSNGGTGSKRAFGMLIHNRGFLKLPTMNPVRTYFVTKVRVSYLAHIFMACETIDHHIDVAQ